MSIRKKARRFYSKHITLRAWSIANWRKGYKYGPIQRYRCCDHTTPYHYANCAD